MQNAVAITFPISASTGREDFIFLSDHEYLRNGKLVTAALWGTQVQRPREGVVLQNFRTMSETKTMVQTVDGLIITFKGIESTLTNTEPSSGVEFPHILAQTQDGKTMVVELEPGMKQTFKAGEDAVMLSIAEKGKSLVMVAEQPGGGYKTFYANGITEVSEGAPTGKRLRRLIETLVTDQTGLNPSLVSYEPVPYAVAMIAEPIPGAAVEIGIPAKFLPVFETDEVSLVGLLGKIGLTISDKSNDGQIVKFLVHPK